MLFGWCWRWSCGVGVSVVSVVNCGGIIADFDDCVDILVVLLLLLLLLLL